MDQQQQFLFNQAQMTPTPSIMTPAYMSGDASMMSINSLPSVSSLFHSFNLKIFFQ